MSESSPAVSVIMPVYNAERYLDESVGSVLAQTLADFELICFNDASTDRSLDILRRYAATDSRVRVIDSPVNVKQGGGRNRAIDAARGRYILFLDADDALTPDALAACTDAIGDTSAQCVFFDYVRYAPSTGGGDSVSPLGADAANLRGDALRRRVIARTTPVWSAMYAREVVTSHGLYFPEGVFYEDNAVALAMQLIAREPVKINRALYLYRVDNQSVSRSSNDLRFFDRIASAETLLGHLKRLGIYGQYADELDFLFTNQYLVHTVYGAIYRFDRPQTGYIRKVRRGIGLYVPDFRRNPYYRAQPIGKKLKLEAHIRLPRLIKLLSNINRRLHPAQPNY